MNQIPCCVVIILLYVQIRQLRAKAWRQSFQQEFLRVKYLYRL